MNKIELCAICLLNKTCQKNFDYECIHTFEYLKQRNISIKHLIEVKIISIFCYNEKCNDITKHELLDILIKPFGYREYRYCQKCNNIIMNDLPIK